MERYIRMIQYTKISNDNSVGFSCTDLLVYQKFWYNIDIHFLNTKNFDNDMT